MYFLLRHFLSLVPSVRTFPLSPQSIFLLFYTKHPAIYPLPLTYESVVIFYAHSWFSSSKASCFYLVASNFSWILLKTTMINKVHCMIFCLQDRKNNLLIKQFVMANLQLKNNREKWVKKQ